MTKTGPQTYPGASQTYRYQGVFGGDSMESNVIVWHSTEGTSLPTYSGGSEAPNFTAKPDFKAKRLVWYQHFDFDTSARALVNKAGGVETNTLNVCQVEIVGTCDPATHKKWGSTQHLYMPELPDWTVRDLAAFAKWANANHGVPLTSGVTWKAYPASYGSSAGVRMSASKWEAYRGHCGHQHVPENDHGDPGTFPMAAILTAAKDEKPPADPPKGPTPPTTPAKAPAFPGRQCFTLGAKNTHAKQLQTWLAKGKWGPAYRVGPSDTMTALDLDKVKALQSHYLSALGPADGLTGPKTWQYAYETAVGLRKK